MISFSDAVNEEDVDQDSSEDDGDSVVGSSEEEEDSAGSDESSEEAVVGAGRGARRRPALRRKPGGGVSGGAAVGGRGRGRGRRGRGGQRGSGAARRELPPGEVRDQSYDFPDNGGNTLPPFSPHRPPGVHFPRIVLRNTMTTALEFFKLFFTAELVSTIANYTNHYAYIHIADGHHSSYAQPDGSWKDTSPEEIYKLLGLHMYFGIVNASSLRKYWSKMSPYHGLWARGVMSRNRYFALMSMLHVVDPLGEKGHNKLRKVQFLIDHMKRKCKELYQPSQNVAIDERMVKSRHKSGIRQHIKGKPTKWGIKLWVLADSSNGYTYDFDVYVGQDAAREKSAHGLGYDVVMNLIKSLLHQGYHLFIDNFYTSMQLLRDLFDLGVAATGTVSENRRGQELLCWVAHMGLPEGIQPMIC